MPKFIVGARLHDYGKGSPDELFGRVAADGFAAVQLAYKKCVPSVRSYADVTDALLKRRTAFRWPCWEPTWSWPSTMRAV